MPGRACAYAPAACRASGALMAPGFILVGEALGAPGPGPGPGLVLLFTAVAGGTLMLACVAHVEALEKGRPLGLIDWVKVGALVGLYYTGVGLALISLKAARASGRDPRAVAGSIASLGVLAGVLLGEAVARWCRVNLEPLHPLGHEVEHGPDEGAQVGG